MNEIFFIILVVIAFIGLAVIAALRKKWGNLAWWVFMGVSFGIWEAVQKGWIGATISQANRQIGLENSFLGYLNAAFIAILFGGLGYHLVWDFGLKKMLRKS